jgi:hypothetical protein
MLKSSESVKELEKRASDALRAMLAQVPIIEIKRMELGQVSGERDGDILVNITVSGRPRMLVCEVQSNGQPRYVRTALLELRNYAAHHGSDITPILIAPYLSVEAQAMCREQAVGYLDLEGNARLAFDGVFMERLVSDRPLVERRELKSLFKPKSAQVLRAMLRDPSRPWRVTELAEATGVSLGHVSNVRAGLLDREWAQISGEGLLLSEPDALLDAWRNAYEPAQGKQIRFYSALHGSALENAARDALGAKAPEGRAVFASFSAAHWLAPYGRTGMQYFYADEGGLERLRASLKLSPASKGENIVVTQPKDDSVFFDTVELAPGAVCTSLIQTYLDLSAAGERGQEAAQHLRRERLTWPK